MNTFLNFTFEYTFNNIRRHLTAKKTVNSSNVGTVFDLSGATLSLEKTKDETLWVA